MSDLLTRFGLALLFSILLFGSQAYAQEKVFEILDPSQAELTPEQEEVLAQIQEENTTVSVALAQASPDALSESSVDLSVSAEKTLDAERTVMEKRSDRDFTWEGSVPAGTAVLVVKDGIIAYGTIHAGRESYSIRQLPGGLNAIVRQDSNAFQEDAPAFEEVEQREKGAELRERFEDLKDGARAEEAEPVIDMLVAYTPAVVSAASARGIDVDALIEASIATTELAYQESRINLKLNVVRRHRVNYIESSPQNPNAHDIELAHLMGDNDGEMDEIHGLRDQSNADVIILLINNDKWCGMAADILARSETAFAVVHYGCSADNLTFAHELGHLQGARHNPERDPRTQPFRYGHGYTNARADWRTVMGYMCPPPSPAGPGGCPKIGRFSNPDVTFDGEPTGTSPTHNDARVLNETAAIIAAFRPAVAEPAVAVAERAPRADEASRAEGALQPAQQLGERPVAEEHRTAHQRFLENLTTREKPAQEPPMTRTVVATVTMDTLDHESWPDDDEKSHFERTTEITLGPDRPQHSFEVFTDCAGAEVRVELAMRVVWSVDGTVFADSAVRLFEGESCATADIEAEWLNGDLDVFVPVDGSQTRSYRITNEDEGRDYSDFTYTVTNFPG